MFLIFQVCLKGYSQVPNGHNEFRYPSGVISSEGPMKNGRPEGYWKTYYENGILKTEGNRVNHLLDSLWKFYDKDGVLSTCINYKEGQKNGFKKTFNKDSVVVKEEHFRLDTITFIKRYFHSGNIKSVLPFFDGEKHGYSFEFDTTGLEQVWWKYKNGKGEKQIINRLNPQGQKTGKWTEFSNGVLRKEVTFSHGFKNGFERVYDYKGNLISVNKYSNGQLLKDVKELQKIQVKKVLGTNGLITKSGGFNSKGEPHGIHREYDNSGEVSGSKVFNNGVLTGVGIVEKNGNKNGKWILYYDSGKKLAEGNYKNGKKVGTWIYFHENGLKESEGIYSDNGKQDGLWKEYFSNGNLLEEVNFYEGLYDGEFKAYNDSGKIIVQGNFKEDYEDGSWLYKNGHYSEYGNYIDGQKTGEWKSFYKEEQIIFKGSYQNGLPEGKHMYWYPSGGVRNFGEFRTGRKSGKWIYYSEGGKVLMITEYSDGLERNYNGYTIDPAHDVDDYIEYDETGYE